MQSIIEEHNEEKIIKDLLAIWLRIYIKYILDANIFFFLTWKTTSLLT